MVKLVGEAANLVPTGGGKPLGEMPLTNRFDLAGEGAEGLGTEGLIEAGVNVSAVHTDFMVGGAEVDVDGIASTGSETPILRDNAWVLGAA